MNCHRADRVGIVTVRDRRDLQTGHCQLLLSLGPGKPGSAPSSAGGGEGVARGRRHGDTGSLEPLPHKATRFRCVGAF